MKAFRRGLVLALALLPAAGCVLLVDTDALKGPSTLAADAADAADVDAAATVSLTDTLADASDGNPDASTGFCERHPTALYCADFDQAVDISAWGAKDVTVGGSLGVVSDSSVSPPRSLFATVEGAGEMRARLLRTFPSPQSSMRLSFSARVATNSTDDEPVFVFDFGVYEIDVQLGPSRAKLKELFPGDGGTAFTDHLFTGGYTLDTWTRIVVEINLTPSAGGGFSASSVHVDRDGVRVLPDTSIPLHQYIEPSWRVQMGLCEVHSGERWTSYIDDVLIERL